MIPVAFEIDDERQFTQQVARGIPTDLPSMPPSEPGVNHAPARRQVLNPIERQLALKNALRYFPARFHAVLAPEFARELAVDGHIYMRRFRPTYPMRARPIDRYPGRSIEARAIMLMITNNLDPRVAQHPHELLTYGGNGAVFQNWAQYLLTMRYLAEMSDTQTLVLYSGHPLGLFPSTQAAPRVVLTNGMVVPNYSSPEEFERLNALGVTSYGQMTAGSFMYIGPQGIVHGTTITLLNAGRRYLGLSSDQNLAGRLFISSGLGGMSGAQAKAAVIAGAVGVVAEINPLAVRRRHEQGWVTEVESDLDKTLRRIDRALKRREPLSLAYQGNVVDLWERCLTAGVAVDLGSDQTSLHNPYGGGYYPAGISFEESQREMAVDPSGFRERVHRSLRRQVAAINGLATRGLTFWDYGNAFLLEASRAGAAVSNADGSFRYPSYVEDIMGPICFDYGFGPFRWVCTSGSADDLRLTDRIAATVIRSLLDRASDDNRQQLLDNLHWIEQAETHQLVVGSQARILYADAQGRAEIGLAFNRAIRDGTLRAPIVLGRDHHDVSGTDSPYRETADIRDGSNHCADMAVHNVIGDSFRGASWVSLHNGGGVGWGEVINGGFGLVLDGSLEMDQRAVRMLHWDVNHGVARRAWAHHPAAQTAIRQAMAIEPQLNVTLPETADGQIIRDALEQAYREND